MNHHFKSLRCLLVFNLSVLLCPNLYSVYTIHAPFSSLYSQLLSWTLHWLKSKSKSKSHCDWRLVSQYIFVVHVQIFIAVLKLRWCFLRGAFSDERTSLSFVYDAGPCQRSLSRVRVPWDSRQYLTVSDLRLPFSSLPTTRKVTVTEAYTDLRYTGAAQTTQ
jgi:hypothetical protein